MVDLFLLDSMDSIDSRCNMYYGNRYTQPYRCIMWVPAIYTSWRWEDPEGQVHHVQPAEKVNAANACQCYQKISHAWDREHYTKQALLALKRARSLILCRSLHTYLEDTKCTGLLWMQNFRNRGHLEVVFWIHLFPKNANAWGRWWISTHRKKKFELLPWKRRITPYLSPQRRVWTQIFQNCLKFSW